MHSLTCKVKSLADRVLEYQNSYTTLADLIEGRVKNNRLPDFTLNRILESESFFQAVLGEVSQLAKEPLPYNDGLMLDLIDFTARHSTATDFCPADSQYYWLDFNITPYSCPIKYIFLILRNFPIATAADLESYAVLISQYPGCIQAVGEKLMGQAARGIYLPEQAAALSLKMLESLIHNLSESPLSPDGLKKAGVSDDKLTGLINAKINEANLEIEGLINYIQGEYGKNTAKHAGLWQYPGGDGYYRFLIDYYTNTSLSPVEIHKLGLSFVEAAASRMEKIRRTLGFECSKGEFHDRLKSVPGFFPERPEEIGLILDNYIERIKPVLPDYFSVLPEAGCEVRPLDPASEAAITFGIYVPPSTAGLKGIYYYNGSGYKDKCQISAGSLIYHELLPGHHLHWALINENRNLHPLSRQLTVTAYVEGWAEYAASLAGDMGMYKDLYDEYGRLEMEIFTSVRLVVDTGMNALGWSLEKAAEYMRRHTDFTDAMIYSEILRYSTDIPGQSLSYKMGSMKITELQRRAREALGRNFDIKGFHTAVLELGLVPLHILEKHIDNFISLHIPSGKDMLTYGPCTSPPY